MAQEMVVVLAADRLAVQQGALRVVPLAVDQQEVQQEALRVVPLAADRLAVQQGALRVVPLAVDQRGVQRAAPHAHLDLERYSQLVSIITVANRVYVKRMAKVVTSAPTPVLQEMPCQQQIVPMVATTKEFANKYPRSLI